MLDTGFMVLYCLRRYKMSIRYYSSEDYGAPITYGRINFGDLIRDVTTIGYGVNPIQISHDGVNVTIVTTLPHGCTVSGTLYKITGIGGSTEYNGEYYTNIIDANTMTFDVTLLPVIPAQLTNTEPYTVERGKPPNWTVLDNSLPDRYVFGIDGFNYHLAIDNYSVATYYINVIPDNTPVVDYYSTTKNKQLTRTANSSVITSSTFIDDWRIIMSDTHFIFITTQSSTVDYCNAFYFGKYNKHGGSSDYDIIYIDELYDNNSREVFGGGEFFNNNLFGKRSAYTTTDSGGSTTFSNLDINGNLLLQEFEVVDYELTPYNYNGMVNGLYTPYNITTSTLNNFDTFETQDGKTMLVVFFDVSTKCIIMEISNTYKVTI